MELEDPGGPVSPVARKTRKAEPSKQEQGKTKKERPEAQRQMLQESRLYDEMVVKACLLKHIKDP